ncbi:AMP-binding protein [Glaciecola siphonariae]|uniref:AMP-binding protein n=1 Tax=Glaciecola siphonariae TaxID=521012 RepID=A0ABV9LVP3_9ALTE
MNEASRRWIITSFLNKVNSVPHRVAVQDAQRKYSYVEFFALVMHLYQHLKESNAKKPVGLYSGREITSYAGMWACIFHGVPFVPLNPALPKQRIETIIDLLDIKHILCHTNKISQAKGLSCAAQCFDIEPSTLTVDELPQFELATLSGLIQNNIYILFTSGSTGVPKGVPISYKNFKTFLENAFSQLPYLDNGRYAQVCEISFDVSMQEIFAALLNGGTLFPARSIDLFNPINFIQQNSIAVLHAVPSLIRVGMKNPAFKPSCFSTLKLSIFNGEPLTRSMALTWVAASESQHEVWNYYGPTECTVAILSQKVQQHDDLMFDKNNIAIGRVFDKCSLALLVDGNIVCAADLDNNMTGELLLGGQQQFDGYLKNTGEDPFIFDADETRYYKTGDRVKYKNKLIFHIGRIDYQVKVGGHRIELMEVEHHLKSALETEALVVLAMPISSPEYLILCVQKHTNLSEIKRASPNLPYYMMPKKVMRIDQFPLNQNGKVDRPALASTMSERI